jgi:putative ABC transport system permease protein
MKFFPLVWRNLLRRRVRTTLTLLSIVVAFTLLGTLMAIGVAFSGGVTIAGAERLVMLDKVSIINPLPIGYGARISGVPGVADVTHANWFGGIYQDSRNFFPNLAVDAESWLRMHPEFIAPVAQKKTWLADRTGAMVGAETARRFGWKIGDRVPLQGTIYRTPDGRPWDFTIDAIYSSDDSSADLTQFFFHYDYLNETVGHDAYGGDEVSWYVIKVSDPRQSEQVARRLDALFANSFSETKTATEKAFVSNFARQIGDIGPIVFSIAAAVLFTILLVSGNTMAQAIRERKSEFAVLKTLGFSDGRIVGLVLAESCLLAILGGALGLLSSTAAIVLVGDPTHGLLPPLYVPPGGFGLGAGLMVALGLAAGALPALQVQRLRIVDALRRQ